MSVFLSSFNVCLLRHPGLRDWLRRGVLASVAVLALGGCVRQETDVTRIQYAIWGSAEQVKIERGIIAEFEKAHPAIKVDLLAIGARYENKIQAMMVGGVAPDVLLVEMAYYHDWARRGVLQDVTALTDDLQQRDEMLPVARQAFSVDARFYAVPLTAPGFGVFVNRDALAAAGLALPPDGLTWSWLEENAGRLSRRSGNPDAPVDYLMVMPDPLIFLWGFGGGVVDDIANPQRITGDTPENRAAIACMQRLHASGGVLSQSAVFDPNSPQFSQQLFEEQKTAIHFGFSSIVPSLLSRAKFQWEVLAMPAGPVSNVTLHAGTALAVSRTTKQREAAETFVRFYTSPVGLRRLVEGERVIPCWRSAAYGPELRALPPAGRRVLFSHTMEAGASRGRLYAPGGNGLLILVRDYLDAPASDPRQPPEKILRIFEAEASRWLERQRRRGGLAP